MARKKSSVRLVPPEDLGPFSSGPLVGKEGRRGRDPDLVSGGVYPEPNVNRACVAPKKRDKSGKEVKQPMRDCHLELSFLGAKHAKKAGVEPGIYVRACEREKEVGVLVPVKDHVEAERVAREICACRRSGKTTKACAKHR